MLKLYLAFATLFAIVRGDGEFTVLHRPSSILFKGHDRLDESLLKDMYTATLGFTIEQDSNWQGMYLLDPFQLPEAIVTVAVEGVSDIGESKGHSFPLHTDEDESDIYHVLHKRIEERFPLEKSKFVHADLSDGLRALQNYKILNGIKNDKTPKIAYKHLKANIEEDQLFMNEMDLLNAVADKIASSGVMHDSVPDLFWFKVSSLHGLSDLHGVNSTVTKEAKQLLNAAVSNVNEAFNKAYEGRVLVSVIASDAAHTRKARQADDKKDETPNQYNLAKGYSADYPIIFNIILWFGVAMIFSLLAISIFIGTMDPGRDSIIYRMTSTRMKKDN